jgi:acetyltransferase-like isoleucine patch superfamily enzyme
MNGRPLIRCARGAELILEQDVRLNTNPSSNPLIGRARSSLSAVAPGARLILRAGVGASGVCITAAKEVIIGEKTILGADVLITDTDFHLPDGQGGWLTATVETSSPVYIGKGCFIGARATILKGVTIGDGAVVGAGAVVTKDVPPACLASGNPASSRPLAKQWLHAPRNP